MTWCNTQLETQGVILLLILCAYFAHLILKSTVAPGVFSVLTLLLVQVQGIIYRQLSPRRRGRKNTMLAPIQACITAHFCSVCVLFFKACISWKLHRGIMLLNELACLLCVREAHEIEDLLWTHWWAYQKKIGLSAWQFQDCVFYLDSIALPVDVHRVWVRQVLFHSANIGLSTWRLIPPSWICSVYLTQWFFDTQKQSTKASEYHFFFEEHLFMLLNQRTMRVC